MMYRLPGTARMDSSASAAIRSIILSDMRMPEMDGQALYEQVRSDYPQALKRIAFITG